MVEPQQGETWQCRGKVTKKYVASDEHLVEREIWVENGKGEQTTRGSTVVALPSRG